MKQSSNIILHLLLEAPSFTTAICIHFPVGDHPLAIVTVWDNIMMEPWFEISWFVVTKGTATITMLTMPRCHNDTMPQ